MSIQAGMGIYEGIQGQDNVNSAANALTGLGQNEINATAVSPQSAAQTSGSYGIGQELQALYQNNLAGGNPEQEYQNQGPLAQATYNQTLAQAQNPLAGYQSALAPSLEQAQNSINEYYNARGLDNSGIAIGSMGEAGVDLAIQNAQNEMQYQQQSLQNAGTLSSNISTLQQRNASPLQDLFGTEQTSGIQSQQLANQGLEAGTNLMAYPQQAQLGYGYGELGSALAVPGQIAGQAEQLGAAFLGGV